MRTCYFMCGIPGSGKSTYAKTNYPNLPVVSRDIIRYELGFVDNANKKAVCTPERENQVTNVEYDLIRGFGKIGQDFVLDDTNTNKLYRNTLIEVIRKAGFRIVGINIRTNVNVCIERRRNQIPEAVIRMLDKKCKFLTNDDVDDVINVE